MILGNTITYFIFSENRLINILFTTIDKWPELRYIVIIGILGLDLIFIYKYNIIVCKFISLF